MKDERLIELKLRAEKDRKLSDGAHRTLALLVSDRYLSRDLAEDEFPLPWSMLFDWQHLSRSTAERRIDELVDRGYLKRCDLRGCPATWWFVFTLRCVKTGASGCVKNVASGCVKTGARHISNALRAEKKKKRGQTEEDRQVSMAEVIKGMREAIK